MGCGGSSEEKELTPTQKKVEKMITTQEDRDLLKEKEDLINKIKKENRDPTQEEEQKMLSIDINMDEMIGKMKDLIEETEDEKLKEKVKEIEEKYSKLKQEWNTIAKTNDQEMELLKENKEYEDEKKELKKEYEDLNLFQSHGSDSQLVEKYPEED
ncbi:MAG: hypothetical protein MJ252_20500 [archaeon]|nr:hypothetical protein [archaeon]